MSTEQSTKIVLFGGSFNPVHMAHVFATCYLSSMGSFDQVIVMPVYKHPFGKDLAPYEHRYEMCRMSVGWIPKVTISDVERQLGTSITANTIGHLKEIHPDWDIHFVIGSDAAQDLKDGKWEDSDKLLEMAKPFVLGRAGHKFNNISILPDISSTEVRASIQGQISSEIAESFLPHGVYDYIKNNQLYLPKGSK